MNPFTTFSFYSNYINLNNIIEKYIQNNVKVFFFFFFFFVIIIIKLYITFKEKNKIHEIKYYILYNYKSVFETRVSNFSHSSMITPRPLLRVIISVLVLSNESVSDL